MFKTHTDTKIFDNFKVKNLRNFEMFEYIEILKLCEILKLYMFELLEVFKTCKIKKYYRFLKFSLILRIPKFLKNLVKIICSSFL